jgi:E3 ubiquitin-protein ligase NRDP1
MGYEINRFHGIVDEELICSICSSVLEEPVQVLQTEKTEIKSTIIIISNLKKKAPDCEHAFCYGCISQWLHQQPTCPVDRQPIYLKDLKPVPRILKNLLSK